MSGQEVRKIVLSSRGPLTFEVLEERSGVSHRVSGGGVATILIPAIPDTSFTWVAAAQTDGDRVVAGRAFTHRVHGKELRLRYVDAAGWAEFADYVMNLQLGLLSNSDRLDDTTARAHFEQWWKACDQLAEVVLEELGDAPGIVMLNDLQVYGAATLIRKRRPDVRISTFVHTPWAEPYGWRMLPVAIKRRVFEAILQSDLVGLQSSAAARAFMRSMNQTLELDVDYTSRTVHGDREVAVRVYPAQADIAGYLGRAEGEHANALVRKVAVSKDTQKLYALARSEPTKNLERVLEAIVLLLEAHPEMRRQLQLHLQVIPTRQHLKHYRDYLARIRRMVHAINAEHGEDGWSPIRAWYEDDRDLGVAHFRDYDVMIVNPLADGRNLIALEAVALNERGGVLILSTEAGAFEDLGEYAIGIDPFDVEDLANAMFQALMMAPEERHRRSVGLKERATARTPADWLTDQVGFLLGSR